MFTSKKILLIISLVNIICCHVFSIKKSFGQKCSKSIECMNRLKCNNEVCACPENSIWSLKKNKCLSCQNKWFKFKDQCYFISTQKLSWDSARQDCRAKNSDLSSNSRSGYREIARHHKNSDTSVSAGFYHLVNAISWLVYDANHA